MKQNAPNMDTGNGATEHQKDPSINASTPTTNVGHLSPKNDNNNAIGPINRVAKNIMATINAREAIGNLLVSACRYLCSPRVFETAYLFQNP